MRVSKRNILVWAVIAAVFVAFGVKSNQDGQIGLFIGLLATFGGIFALLSWPDAAAFIERRGKVVVAVGLLILAAGAAGIIAVIVFPSVVSAGTGTAMVVSAMLGGMMIANLPRMAKQMRESRADLALLKTRDASPPGFVGTRAGLEAPLAVARDWGMFLQIAGPWTLLMSVLVFAILTFGKALGHIAGGLPLFCFAIAFLASLVVSWPTVMVAWHRWIIAGQRPNLFIALPDRAVLSYGWPLWLFFAMSGTADKMASGQVTQFATAMHLHQASAIGDSAGSVADVLIIALASSAALRLPAIAMGDKGFSRTFAMIEGRRMWPGLPLGLVLSLVPFYFVNWALNQIYESVLKPILPSADLQPVIGGLLVVGVVVTFGGIASGVTFLSRGYLAAKARTA